MKNLFDAETTASVKARLLQLQADSAGLWGKMNPAQMLAHCARAFEMPMGQNNPPRMWIGRLFGPLAKHFVITKGEPMRRNVPSEKSLIVNEERDFATERQRLLETIDLFAAGGPEECTKHPHFFFGPLKPVEWAALMYQHLDHHLRQFGR